MSVSAQHTPPTAAEAPKVDARRLPDFDWNPLCHVCSDALGSVLPDPIAPLEEHLDGYPCTLGVGGHTHALLFDRSEVLHDLCGVGVTLKCVNDVRRVQEGSRQGARTPVVVRMPGRAASSLPVQRRASDTPARCGPRGSRRRLRRAGGTSVRHRTAPPMGRIPKSPVTTGVSGLTQSVHRTDVVGRGGVRGPAMPPRVALLLPRVGGAAT